MFIASSQMVIWPRSIEAETVPLTLRTTGKGPISPCKSLGWQSGQKRPPSSSPSQCSSLWSVGRFEAWEYVMNTSMYYMLISVLAKARPQMEQ
eukprot:1140376-Pelagomonas_calceolata.AAC.1